jgi:integrase/recombinase XerD
MPEAHEDLVLFKRHDADCPVHKSRIPVANRRFWMECACKIWIVGRTPNGDIVPRQSTGCRDLKEAQAFRLSLMQQTQPDVDRGPLLSECVEKYLSSRAHELGSKTSGQYAIVLKRLQVFCAKNRVSHMKDLTVDLLETFKVEGLPKKMADTSKSTVVAKLRCFLRAAFRRGWISESLADRVTGHKAVYEQKEPYTDKEVKLILEEALKLTGGRHGYSSQPATFQLLLELMVETGLRSGDAVQFDPAMVSKGEHMWIYTYVMEKRKKTDKLVPREVYLSDRLKTSIDKCTWLSDKKPFHYECGDYSLAKAVYERMQEIGKRCGVNDCRPHRLRDTFAVRKLLSGLQLDDVSRLLGHSSVKVTETYYAKWITARKSRLERLLAESLVDG